MRLRTVVPVPAMVLAALLSSAVLAQVPPASQTAQERRQAELDAPKLAEVLELKPGMTVADVGAGFGAMSVVLAKWIGSGHVYATDIGEKQLAEIRDYVKREGLSNVTVLEGAATSTKLPADCCDAIFLRHVYHHLTAPYAFNKSLRASLRPGGRLAVIDFVPAPGSAVPAGAPANRGGHGVKPDMVIDEMRAAGLIHVRTIDQWPPDDKEPTYFLTLFRRK